MKIQWLWTWERHQRLSLRVVFHSCRQPDGTSDENSFFIFFHGGRTFFWKKNGGWLQKMAFSTQKMELSSIYYSSTLSSSSTSSTPCSSVYRFSDYSLTVPSHHVLVPLHHSLPQNEVAKGTNNFFHSWLCQFVPAFVVYPPCDTSHRLSWKESTV